ncbi:MAG: ATP-grasp domain-containing protein [Planctomycetota bacterium]
METLRITVLAGGPDGERGVSLASGRAVAAALANSGHDVHFADAGPGDLAALDVPCDVVFPAMHGPWGEGGPLQDELEARGLAYVGSRPEPARRAMDKMVAKKVFEEAGLLTPAAVEIDTMEPLSIDRDVVVKPLAGGSSLDVFVRRREQETNLADVDAAVSYLLARYGRCMVEDMVDGIEMTVGILGNEALPPIWIDASNTSAGWFDYGAKYRPDGAPHRFDVPEFVTTDVLVRLCDVAVKAHEKLGCRDLSRADMMVTPAGEIWLLEVNTMPGFTGRSLLPDAARHTGLGFEELCDGLVQRAAARGEQTPVLAA